MIDFHSHILWDMDDGADSMGQALSMACLAIEEGIDTIIATPHCIEERDLGSFSRKVEERCNHLQELIREQGLDMTITPGAEVYMDMDFLQREGLESITLNNTKYMLVELPMGDVPRYAEDFFYHLQLKGIVPIIAHPERNLAIIEDPNILFRLVDLGSLAQINTGSVTGFFGSRVQECAKILLTHGMGHLLGTDAHSDQRRGPYMRKAVEMLSSWLDDDKVDEIINKIPRAIYKGKAVYVPTPTEYYKKKKLFSFFRKRIK